MTARNSGRFRKQPSKSRTKDGRKLFGVIVFLLLLLMFGQSMGRAYMDVTSWFAQFPAKAFQHQIEQMQQKAREHNLKVNPNQKATTTRPKPTAADSTSP
jgi:hypothetical protein